MTEEEKELFWMAVRQSILMLLDAIERYPLKNRIKVRTAELRKT